MTIYLLPGVGCDARLFERLDLAGFDVVMLAWPAFEAKDSLAAIAHRLLSSVRTDEPHVLVGVSMGGMVAQELAVLTNPQKVVLISSWTGPHEWPRHVRFGARFGVHRVIREWTMRAAWPVKRVMDPREGAVDRLLWDMAMKQSARQLRNGTAAIMRWNGSPWKGPVVRIHGDKDIVTPLRFPVDHVVKSGQHVMVLTKAEEVSQLLVRCLRS
jgi:pimeloyl-ACP methyl ester carboxylesterase